MPKRDATGPVAPRCVCFFGEKASLRSELLGVDVIPVQSLYAGAVPPLQFPRDYDRCPSWCAR